LAVELYLNSSGYPFVVSAERNETRKVSCKRRKRAIRVYISILVESNFFASLHNSASTLVLKISSQSNLTIIHRATHSSSRMNETRLVR
jgi:hypothetical protein